MTNDILDLVTQIVARDVSTGVEMARSIGHKMPKNFTIGVRIAGVTPGKNGEVTRVRIRLDDVFYDSILTVPFMDGRMSLGKVDMMWREAMQVLRGDALTLAHVWLDRHPDQALSKKDANNALNKLKKLVVDDQTGEAWQRECEIGIDRRSLYRWLAKIHKIEKFR